MSQLIVTIDPLTCACTGYCAEVAPAVFNLTSGGPTVVLDPHPPLDLLPDLREAEALCPTQAICVELLEET
jgi:ferredoxin